MYQRGLLVLKISSGPTLKRPGRLCLHNVHRFCVLYRAQCLQRLIEQARHLKKSLMFSLKNELVWRCGRLRVGWLVFVRLKRRFICFWMSIGWERFYEGKIRSLHSEALVWAGSLAARTSPSRGEDRRFESGPAHFHLLRTQYFDAILSVAFSIHQLQNSVPLLICEPKIRTLGIIKNL